MRPPTTLTSERIHLDRSRQALRQMLSRVEALTNSSVVAGDAVSTHYLMQTLHRRMITLRSDPAVPAFFGRLDYRESRGASRDESVHIGRQHIAADAGSEPLVIDWRAEMALPFYRASASEPMGVGVRRRFGFSTGQLTAFEDEDLTETTDRADASAIIEAEVERPRDGPMRDIVATIQPEQDVLVRSALSTSLCIQGAPGTGKTAVGLHRAAWLLFAYREQLQRAGVVVVGPNQNFLSYIADVLPALGEIEVQQHTIDSLIADHLSHHSPPELIDDSEPIAQTLIKSDARMATVINNALWSGIAVPEQGLVVPRGSRTWRVPLHLVTEVVAELSERGIRYETARRMLPLRLAHQVLLRMEAAGDSPDDRVQAAIARSAPVKAYVKTLWPAVDAKKLIFQLLSDPSFLATHADGVLSSAEQADVVWRKKPRGLRSVSWSSADLALLDEAADQLDRSPGYGHVIIDEAQDLSAMQLRALGRRAAGSVTVLGDVAQATTPWSVGSWSAALAHLGAPDTTVTELTAGFRVPASVIDFAAQLLPVIAPGLAPPHSVRRGRGSFEIRPIADAEADAVAAAVTDLTARDGTIGVIAADSHCAQIIDGLDRAGIAHRSAFDTGAAQPEADHETTTETDRPRVEVIGSRLAKGLEFDHVVVVEPATIADAEADVITGLRRLYIVLTRAVSSLIVIHAKPLPHQLLTQDSSAEC